ncbi:hypothetical protein [Flavobacterium litorale]|uniref:Uncharacterized protein n=1 Tax=Flavobacterium litorale TaxID=2856519 RepID=A0ABX8V7N8_9FLAO|nr:hypothetical protein [Flavobacterium litorale]QYJ68836.1 hypothetical protein K1I41_02850 [Flavobacterium litorale]
MRKVIIIATLIIVVLKMAYYIYNAIFDRLPSIINEVMNYCVAIILIYYGIDSLKDKKRITK